MAVRGLRRSIQSRFGFAFSFGAGHSGSKGPLHVEALTFRRTRYMAGLGHLIVGSCSNLEREFGRQ